jgi:integrase
MNKGRRLSATFVEWHQLTNLIAKLMKDQKYRLALLVSIPSYCGLRIGDVLRLRWIDILDKNDLIIQEGKTHKMREIRINQNLKNIISTAFNAQNGIDPQELIFINRYKTKAISVQFINKSLKKMAVEYGLTDNPTNWKSHMLRKSFGRHAYQASSRSDMGLILLSEIFGHSSPSVTRLYLGLRKEEFDSIYENL